MTLDPQQLGIFLAVYQHRSIGKAASTLGVTQPWVSRSLRKLEDHVGAQLFERHPSGVIPTLAADVLRPYADEITSDARTALEEIAALTGKGTSIVRVGAVAGVSNSLLPMAIDRLLQKWPTLRVQLIEAVEDQLSEALARGQIDIAIAGAMQHPEVNFSAPQRMTDPVIVVASREHPLARKNSTTLKELSSYRWVMPPASTVPRQEFEQRFRKAGLEPPVVTVETRSVSAIRALVALTDMVSWQPRAVLAIDKGAGPIVEIKTPELIWDRQFSVFRREKGLLAPAAKKLVDEIRLLCSPEPARITKRARK
jgi:DNA-binding transcriptional LysR family regulator